MPRKRKDSRRLNVSNASVAVTERKKERIKLKPTEQSPTSRPLLLIFFLIGNNGFNTASQEANLLFLTRNDEIDPPRKANKLLLY